MNTAKTHMRNLYAKVGTHRRQFARQSDGSWLFAERKLIVDWTETRLSNP